MLDFYISLLLTMGCIGLMGVVVAWKFPRFSRRAFEHIDLWAIIAIGMLAAAIVSFAFLAGSLTEYKTLPEANGGLITEAQRAGQLIISCIASIYFTGIGILATPHTKVARWIGACLLIATVLILVLVPSAAMLMRQVAETSTASLP